MSLTDLPEELVDLILQYEWDIVIHNPRYYFENTILNFGILVIFDVVLTGHDIKCKYSLGTFVSIEFGKFKIKQKIEKSKKNFWKLYLFEIQQSGIPRHVGFFEIDKQADKILFGGDSFPKFIEPLIDKLSAEFQKMMPVSFNIINFEPLFEILDAKNPRFPWTELYGYDTVKPENFMRFYEEIDKVGVPLYFNKKNIIVYDSRTCSTFCFKRKPNDKKDGKLQCQCSERQQVISLKNCPIYIKKIMMMPQIYEVKIERYIEYRSLEYENRICIMIEIWNSGCHFTYPLFIPEKLIRGYSVRFDYQDKAIYIPEDVICSKGSSFQLGRGVIFPKNFESTYYKIRQCLIEIFKMRGPDVYSKSWKN